MIARMDTVKALVIKAFDLETEEANVMLYSLTVQELLALRQSVAVLQKAYKDTKQ